MDKKVENALKKWVKENYDDAKLKWTAERSRGNYDDCFEDGGDCGRAYAALEVGNILGMDLEDE